MKSKTRENQISDMAEAVYRVCHEALGSQANEQIRYKTEYMLNQWSDLIFRQHPDRPIFSIVVQYNNPSYYNVRANNALGLEVLKVTRKLKG
jgi:hypothetical protein